MRVVLIYIPHWLDSMHDIVILCKAVEKIYIPHWLDSMKVYTGELISRGIFTFHTG